MIKLIRKPLPNVRKMFRPDPGYVMADADLDRADAQVVAWDADDEDLKRLFRDGIDVHLANAQVAFNLPYKEEDLYDFEYANVLAKKYKPERRNAKSMVHGTNYAGSAWALVHNLGITLAEAKRFQDVWFERHPAIKAWHERIEMQLQTTREVANAFGFRIHYFDRVDDLLPEALAWIAQSTVAIVIDKGIVRIDQTLPEVIPLLQVHDSVVFEYPIHLEDTILPKVHEALHVEIPYEDPLVIGVGVKTSMVSWGDCKERNWPEAA